MSQPRGFRQIVCQACGAAWSDRGARFCGHCGAALGEPTAPDRAADEGSPDGRSRGWILGLLAVGVVATVAAVIGIGGAPAWLASDPREEMSTDVELPDPEAVPDPEPGDEPEPEGGTRGVPGGELACEPEGCELWRIEGPIGTFTVLGSVVIHVETTQRSGGSSLGQGASDEDQPSVEAVVTAHSVESGQDLWTVSRVARRESPSPQSPRSLIPIDEDLVLVGIEGTTSALDPQTGTILWTASLEHEVTEAARGGPGEVILWGPGAPDEVEEAAPEDGVAEGTPEASMRTSPTIGLTAVEAGSGEPLWTDRGSWIMGLDSEHLLLLDEQQEAIAAIDLSTGERLWENELEGQIDPSHVPIRSGRAVLIDGRQVHVLDISTGGPLGSLDLDFEPEGLLTVVGDLLLVTEEPRGSGPGSTPRRAEVHDLFDLDAEPRRFDDLLDSVVMRESGPLSHWDWERSTVEGLVLLTQLRDVARLEALDPDGSSRWQSRVPLAEPDCCVRLQSGRDASTVILVPPVEGAGLPQVISTDTGEWVGSYDVPPSAGDEPPIWFRGLAMYGLVGEGERDIVLAGPAGQVQVSGGGFPLSGAPIPIVQGERGIIAIDPTLVFAEE